MKINYKLLASASVILGAISSNALADGFASSVYSTTGMATSYAGSVTGTHDVSDMFFNPATMSYVKDGEFIASITHLDLNLKASEASATLANNNQGNSDSGQDSQVPAIYFARKINDRTTFGVSLTAPFAVATKYDREWAGRYGNVESNIRTINLNPSLAYKVNSKLSVGAGVQIQHNRAILSKMVNQAPGVDPDSFAKTTGDDVGYGYNFGATFDYNDYLKFGIGYRSKIDHKLKGSTDATALNPALKSDFTASLTTPESLTIGASYKVNSKLDLAYDMTWTRWSRFKELAVKHYDQAASLDGAVDFDYNDSFMYSLGGNYKLSDLSTIRFGTAFEKSGIPDQTREPRIPLGDRYWLSAGYSYKASDSLYLDLAYIHQIHKTVRSNLMAGDPRGHISAKYKNSVNVYSLALRKEF